MIKEDQQREDQQSVFEAVAEERQYQDRKWPGHCHGVGAYLTIMDDCLRKAKAAWAGSEGDLLALREIRQVAAVAVACMEEHGAPRRV